METIKIEFGIDTAFTENVDADKYLKLATTVLRKQLPGYKFSCSVNQDDNAETKILNEDDLGLVTVMTIQDAIVEAESDAINDPRSYKKRCLRIKRSIVNPQDGRNIQSSS